MLKLSSIMICTSDPKPLSDFYTKVFGRPADMAEVEGSNWNLEGANFSILKHSEIEGPSKEPKRIIVNFQTDLVKEEFERIKALGADVVKEPYEIQGMWIATLADPDGNCFQLMSPWKPDDQAKPK